MNAGTVKLVDVPFFTVGVAKFVKHEFENNSLDKGVMEKRFVRLDESYLHLPPYPQDWPT